MKILDKALRIARRTAHPHHVQVRIVLSFIIVLLIAFIAIAATRVWLLPPTPLSSDEQSSTIPFISSILDNLASGVVVSIIAAVGLLIISPKESVDEDVTVLDSWNIRGMLLSPLPETKNYWFRGRSGRFIRSRVLPEMSDAARRESARRSVTLVLPDPRDNATLDSYARYRNSLAYTDRTWSADAIRVEILATILKAADIAANNVFFEAYVSVRSDFSIFRIDMSDDRLVLTREDPKWPAIICSPRSKFYASYLEEIRMAADTGCRLNLSAYPFPDQKLVRQNVESAIKALGLDLTLSDEICVEILKAMKKPDRSYD